MEASQTNHATCKCQNCDGGIQFDASNFAKGETQTIECPHCHLETIIFVPRAASPPTFPANSAAKKVASPTKLIVSFIVFWVIAGVCLVICISSAESNSTVAALFLCLSFIFMIAAINATIIYATQKNPSKPPIPRWICANCGTLLTWLGEGGACSACWQKASVPLGTPRGQELLATYHGTVTAKERVEIGDEATKKLLRTLEPIPASGSIALELEKLAGLVRIGAITNDEWQRAKALYLGQPKVKQEHSLARIQELHGLCQSGALSESEFNMVKWDILAKGMS